MQMAGNDFVIANTEWSRRLMPHAKLRECTGEYLDQWARNAQTRL